MYTLSSYVWIFSLLLYFLDASTGSVIDQGLCNSTKPISKVICQEHSLIINCNNGTVIEFKKGNFGRNGSGHCREIWGLEAFNCDRNEKTLAILNSNCGYKPSCDLLVKKQIFGNPCKGITKYLDVSYACIPLRCSIEKSTAKSEPADTQTTSLSRDWTTRDQLSTGIKDMTDSTQKDTTIRYIPSQQDKTMENIKVLELVGIVIGCIAALIILMIIIVLLIRKRRSNKTSMRNRSNGDFDPTGNEDLQYDYTEMKIQTSGCKKTTEDSGNTFTEQNSKNVACGENLNERYTDQNNDTYVTDNAYDVSGTCGRKIQKENATVYGLCSKATADDSEYDTTLNVDRNDESNYDVTDDTYDVSIRQDRPNNVNNHVDDTYDHFIQDQVQNEYELD